MNEAEYKKLFAAGIEGITLYQETYDRNHYADFHPKGPKSDYDWRLKTHDRAAFAGLRQIGLGSLLGLTDWRLETLALAQRLLRVTDNPKAEIVVGTLHQLAGSEHLARACFERANPAASTARPADRDWLSPSRITSIRMASMARE